MLRFLLVLVLLEHVAGQSLYNTIFFNPNENEVTKNLTRRFPEETYVKVQSYMKDSVAFKHFTLDDIKSWIDNVDRWEEPKDLQKKFAYYLAGYDYDDRPVWIGEVGKYNVRRVLDEGKDAEINLVRYLFKACLRIMLSMQEKDTPAREIRSVFLLGDWDGLDMSQILHGPTITFVLHMVRTYLDFLFLSVGEAWSINANYAAVRAFELLRPLLGGLVERFEIYGTNKAQWAAALRRTLPPSCIPPWYGGPKEFKPLKVFG